MKSKSLHHHLEKLEADKSHYHEGTKLQQLQYNKEQENIIASQQGIKKTEIDFHTLYSTLLQLGFTQGDLHKITTPIGGIQNLQAVYVYYEPVIKLGFNKDAMVKIVAHVDGAKNLKVVDEGYETFRSFGFDNNDILRMVSFNGGFNNLQSVIKYYLRLRDLGFDNVTIVKMAAHPYGVGNLQAVIDFSKAIKSSSFDRAKIASCIENTHRPAALETLFHSPNSRQNTIYFNINSLNPLGVQSSQSTTIKETSILSSIAKDKVFFRFDYATNRKSGWFTLKFRFHPPKIRTSILVFFKKHPTIADRYFSFPHTPDKTRLFAYINYPGLQNANEVQVKAALILLFCTRIDKQKSIQKSFLKNSQATRVSNSKAIVRFDRLADLWHQKFPVLDKSIIRDVFASWFIDVINEYDQRQNKGKVIPPGLIVHNGEFVSVNDYPLLLDNFAESLAHWMDPLPQELSLSPIAQTETIPSNLFEPNAEVLEIDSPLQALPRSDNSATNDPTFNLPGKRKRDDTYQANKKHKSNEERCCLPESTQNKSQVDFLVPMEENWFDTILTTDDYSENQISGYVKSSLLFFPPAADQEIGFNAPEWQFPANFFSDI